MIDSFAPSLAHHVWKSALISGILSLIVGVVILAWPGPSILVAAVAFGTYLVITGITQIVSAFGTHVSTESRVLLFISGAASLVLAALALHYGADSAVLLLSIWIGIGFILRGIATTIAAISAPALPGRGWTIFMGILTLVAGFVVMDYPISSIVVLAMVTGAWFVVIGIFEIISSFSIRKTAESLGG